MWRACACCRVKSQFKRGRGFFEDYVPVFLAGENVYRIKKFKRCAKKLRKHKLCAGIVPVVIWCP